MAYSNFFIICLACFAEQTSAYWACKEPAMCECLTGCKVYSEMQQEPKYVCEKPLNVLPTLKIFWGPRLIEQQITWAKEKLAYEAAKTYESPWKEHVIGTQTGGVIGMYALLGMSINVMKATYTGAIQTRTLAASPKRKCDFAMCIAYCSSKCESMCEDLESTDEEYLTGISWTKMMCDVDGPEGSKALMKSACTDLKAAQEGCDANCDGTENARVVFPLAFLGLSLVFFH